MAANLQQSLLQQSPLQQSINNLSIPPKEDRSTPRAPLFINALWADSFGPLFGAFANRLIFFEH
jgi:hypothetical protein